MSQEASVQEKVKAAIADLMPTTGILVACSGGPDSVALAYCLHQLGISIALAHVNYGLRGSDADEDERFVQALAKKLNVPCMIHKADPDAIKASSDSVQVEARTIRYRFFESCLATLGWDYCATGHHADDQAETILMSLMRGAGPQLMRGIPSRRLPYIRPLLAVSRADILTFLHEKKQTFRTDKSNASDAYLRNRIRHEVLPALNRIHPHAGPRLRKQQEWYEQEHALLQDIIAPYRAQAAKRSLEWERFVEEVGEKHLPILLAYVLADWGITGTAAEAALRFAQNQPGTHMDTPAGRLLRTRAGFQLLGAERPSFRPQVLTSITSQVISLGERQIEITAPFMKEPDFHNTTDHFIDVDQIVLPLTFRSWKQGDKMQPYGMDGHKLLSDIFIDGQFSPDQKHATIVVEDQKGIICLSEYRVSDRVKLRPDSKRLARLRFL